jgi:hypothetical protein
MAAFEFFRSEKMKGRFGTNVRDVRWGEITAAVFLTALLAMS